ncbi:MAG TPA: pteridine reductase [Xanthomonadaceae bacterium]|nr:pteridine reductase [Xanthomonadales bacterium]HPF73279.1 pteridine reductase [Xanthomonadaceae bacterium]HRX99236.1 pteridine reductase [Xanthomonadaceae bacterium]
MTAETSPTTRVALITGAARRIGAAIVETLHEAGYNVAIHYRASASDAEILAAKLESRRAGSTLLLPADLADTSGLAGLVEKTLARFDSLDALVNNASGFRPTPVGDITEADWDELFAANAKAPLFLSQAAAPALRESRGAIVNIVDIYAERPLANHPVYCMAKAALAMLTRSLARDLGPDVRVNGVAPGAILWPEDGSVYTDKQAMIERTPLQRTGHPQDIADAVLWLLRDARHSTGEIVRVDGGRTLVI